MTMTMSRRVTNLIESILGAPAASEQVAEAVEATYAPKTTTAPPTTKPAGPSILESAATGVVAGATKSGRTAVLQKRKEKVVAAALKAKKEAAKKPKPKPKPKPPAKKKP